MENKMKPQAREFWINIKNDLVIDEEWYTEATITFKKDMFEKGERVVIHVIEAGPVLGRESTTKDEGREKV